MLHCNKYKSFLIVSIKFLTTYCCDRWQIARKTRVKEQLLLMQGIALSYLFILVGTKSGKSYGTNDILKKASTYAFFARLYQWFKEGFLHILPGIHLFFAHIKQYLGRRVFQRLSEAVV